MSTVYLPSDSISVKYNEPYDLPNNPKFSFVYPKTDNGKDVLVQIGTQDAPSPLTIWNGSDFDGNAVKSKRTINVPLQDETTVQWAEAVDTAARGAIQAHGEQWFGHAGAEALYQSFVVENDYGKFFRAEYEESGKHRGDVFVMPDSGEIRPGTLEWCEDGKPSKITGVVALSWYLVVTRNTRKKVKSIRPKFRCKQILVCGKDTAGGGGGSRWTALNGTREAVDAITGQGIQISDPVSKEAYPDTKFANIQTSTGDRLIVDTVDITNPIDDKEYLDGVMWTAEFPAPASGGPAGKIDFEGLSDADNPEHDMSTLLAKLDEAILGMAQGEAKERLGFTGLTDEAIAEMYSPVAVETRRGQKLGGIRLQRLALYIDNNAGLAAPSPPALASEAERESLFYVHPEDCPRHVRAAPVGLSFSLRIDTEGGDTPSSFGLNVFADKLVIKENATAAPLFVGGGGGSKKIRLDG